MSEQSTVAYDCLFVAPDDVVVPTVVNYVGIVRQAEKTTDALDGLLGLPYEVFVRNRRAIEIVRGKELA
jgi:hypothetical protein